MMSQGAFHLGTDWISKWRPQLLGQKCLEISSPWRSLPHPDTERWVGHLRKYRKIEAQQLSASMLQAAGLQELLREQQSIVAEQSFGRTFFDFVWSLPRFFASPHNQPAKREDRRP